MWTVRMGEPEAPGWRTSSLRMGRCGDSEVDKSEGEE